jgi:hypothetical protein
MNDFEYFNKDVIDAINTLPPIISFIVTFIYICGWFVTILLMYGAMTFLIYAAPFAILGGIVYGIFRCYKRFYTKR